MNLLNIFLVLLFKEILVENAVLVNKRSITRSKHNKERILWNKPLLTYSLFGKISAYNQTNISAVRRVLLQSFSEWEANSCFKFRDVTPSSNSDIKIIFTNDRSRNSPNRVEDPFSINYTHHNCERYFRGNAAHAFFRYNSKFPAHIHVNNEVFWMESNKPSGSVSLKTLFLHEIGHTLGLYHSVDLNSVMYQYIFTNRVQPITQTDRDNLKELYDEFCKKQSKTKKRIKF